MTLVSKIEDNLNLIRLIPEKISSYVTRNIGKIPFSLIWTIFQGFFFPSTFIEWKNLDLAIRNWDSFGNFKKNILKYVSLTSSGVFNSDSRKAIKLITRLSESFV